MHIPDKGQVTTRYYGWYANRPRGMRHKAAPTGADGPPTIVPARPLAPTEASRRWAALLQQIFEVDPLVCPTCHDAMRIVACITQTSVIDQILTHVRTRASREAHARPRSPIDAGPASRGRHAPHARSPTRRRSPEWGPDAPPPRGDRRRGRLVPTGATDWPPPASLPHGARRSHGPRGARTSRRAPPPASRCSCGR
ncbi:MAG: hypothetical protein IPK33_12695 [Gemmatimonadetes bacterium]|nr:hypothetical protein [Gemmatimonadota bacterium]